MSRLTWRFTAFDSWFFRESRPFNTIGGSELSSVFPPSPATMAGAIRSAIGDHQNIDWQKYHQQGGYPELKAQIGDSDSLGTIRLKGVFLSRKNPEKNCWERLYPVPADLAATLMVVKEKVKIKNLYFLQQGESVHCDLGKQVCLAVAPKNAPKGIKPLEDYWLTQTGLTKVLNGSTDLTEKTDLIEEFDLIHSAELFTNEARLGIARNNQARTAEQGMLYQTQHIRPKNAVAIEVDVEGLETTQYPSPGPGIVRLGGEGRGAAFEVFAANNNLIKIEDSKTEVLGIKLVLLSAVYVPQLNGYTPLPDFKQIEQGDKTVWQGQINNIALTLHCAVIGKVLREGGWDLRKKQAKPVRSLLPVGSVFYCKVDNGDIKKVLETLQTAQLVNKKTDDNPLDKLDEALGRGLLTAGLWFNHDSIADKETHP